MKVTGVCFLIVVLCSTLGEGKKQKKLEIISEVGMQPFSDRDIRMPSLLDVHVMYQHIPDDCSSQAAKGDALTVHYTV